MSIGVKDLLKLHQRLGCSISHSEEHELELLMESGKEAMRLRAKSLLAEAGTLPVMVSYSSDETRVKVVKKIKVSSHAHDFKEGKQCYGSLVQHHFLRYFDASGQAHSAALLMEPTQLEFGKTGDALWAVAREDMFVAKEHGHAGISIAH